MRQPIATWNRARGAWETPALNLLCGHLEPFSQTWPKSGSMRNGSVFPQQQQAPAIFAGASSSSPGLLPTPTAHDDGRSPEAHLAMKARMPGGPRQTITSLSVLARNGLQQPDGDLLPTPLVTNRAGMTPSPATLEGKRGTDLGPAIGSLLPTPRASARENRQTKRTPSQEVGAHGLCLAAEVLELLPTPNATDGQGGVRAVPESRTHRGPDHGPRLRDLAPALLPTPSVADGMGGHRSRSGDRSAELLLPGIAQELSAAMRQQSGGTSECSAGERRPR